MAEPYDSELLTFDVIGTREALANTISDVTPEETAFLSNCGTAPNPKATRWDWLTQSLNAAVGTNFQLEGATFDPAPVSQPARLYNYMQISTKSLQVSNTVEATNRAGRQGELVRGMLRAGIELKRDMNKSLIGTPQVRVAGNASTPRKTSTMHAWIPAANCSVGAGAGAAGTGDGSDVQTGGDDRVFTETILKDILSKVWVSSGTPGKRVVYLGEVNITRASGFIGIAQMNSDAASKTIYGVADIYKGQHETVYFIPERHMVANDCFVICHAFTKIAKLRDFTPIDLAIVGDAIPKGLVVEYGLQVDNPLANGAAFDLTAS